MSSRSTMMRVKPHTLRLIRMYAGELQAMTGISISDDDALWHFFSQYRPELVEKVKEMVNTNEGNLNLEEDTA